MSTPLFSILIDGMTNSNIDIVIVITQVWLEILTNSDLLKYGNSFEQLINNVSTKIIETICNYQQNNKIQYIYKFAPVVCLLLSEYSGQIIRNIATWGKSIIAICISYVSNVSKYESHYGFVDNQFIASWLQFVEYLRNDLDDNNITLQLKEYFTKLLSLMINHCIIPLDYGNFKAEFDEFRSEIGELIGHIYLLYPDDSLFLILEAFKASLELVDWRYLETSLFLLSRCGYSLQSQHINYITHVCSAIVNLNTTNEILNKSIIIYVDSHCNYLNSLQSDLLISLVEKIVPNLLVC